MFCMNCGTQLPDGAKFCMNCGTKVGEVGAGAVPAGKNIPRTRCCTRTAWLISSPLPISASAV